MADILDPANGVYALGGSSLPTILYTPNTQANVVGDGDIDGYYLWRDISTAVSGSGMYDVNAIAPQVLDFTLTIIVEDVNARGGAAGVIDAVVEGAKNAGMGTYLELRPGSLKFGNIADGAKVTFATVLALSVPYYFRLTYDPAADAVDCSIFSDALRTVLIEASGALDMSVGPDSQAGGLPVFQALDMAARGKGAAPYEYIIADVTFPTANPTATIAGTFPAVTGVIAASTLAFNPDSGATSDVYDVDIRASLDALGLFETSIDDRSEIKIQSYESSVGSMSIIQDSEFKIELPSYVLLQVLQGMNGNPPVSKLWKDLSKVLTHKFNNGMFT